MLESVTNPTTNINNLNLTEPARRDSGLVFNPERDIPADIWLELDDTLATTVIHLKKFGDEYDYLELASKIALLSRNKVNLRANKVFYPGFEAVIKEETYAWRVISLGQIAIIDPNVRKNLEQAFEPESLQASWYHFQSGLLAELNNVYRSTPSENSIRLFGLLNTIVAARTYSDQAFQEMKPTVEGLKNIVRYDLDFTKQLLKSKNIEDYPGAVAGYAFKKGAFRILFPEDNESVMLNPQEWDKLVSALDMFAQKKDWKQYLQLAVSLKILSADDIKFEEGQGMEIILKAQEEDPDLNITIPSLPEVRKF